MSEADILKKIDENTKAILEAIKLHAEFAHIKMNLVEKKASTPLDDDFSRTLTRAETQKKEELFSFIETKLKDLDESLEKHKPKPGPKSYY